MEESWLKVREFHLKFRHPCPNVPIYLEKKRVEARFNWMQEELNEFKDSVNLEEQADAMIDLIYFALGTLVEMGIKPSKLFEIVHQANMSKLFPDGEPHYNEEGKTIKPSNWVDPEQQISNEIQRQIEES